MLTVRNLAEPDNVMSRKCLFAHACSERAALTTESECVTSIAIAKYVLVWYLYMCQAESHSPQRPAAVGLSC